MSDNPAWAVAFTRHGEEDIKSILAYMAEREDPDLAETVLEQFIEARDSLRRLPDRGRVPLELMRVNILSYREIQARPFRIIYQIDKAAQKVFIHIVADGRRNVTEILKERLLTTLSLESQLS